MAFTSGGTTDITISMSTDNAGNAYGVAAERFKKWPVADIMMETMITCQYANTRLAVSHVKRDHNTWADQLTNNKVEGFDPALRIHPDITDDNRWWIWHELKHGSDEIPNEAKKPTLATGSVLAP